MSKAEVKKYIKSLERDSLEELVMDLYSARKEAKEYLEYVIKPNDKGKLEQYRENITKEFFPSRGDAKMRFSVCRKAVSEFKSLDPAPEFLADLMLYIQECASEIANDWGDMWEQFYDAAENNFKAAMKHISEYQLQSLFQKRIDIILEASDDRILKDAGAVSAEQAKEFAETEFEKYRVIQDRLFESDFDRFELPTLPFDKQE